MLLTKKYFNLKALLFCLIIVSSSCIKEDLATKSNGESNQTSGNMEIAFPDKSGTIKKASFQGNSLFYEEIEGKNVFEGDIILSNEQLQSNSANERETGNGRSLVKYRWTGKVVYYTINDTLPNQERVTDAIAHWESNTGIRFLVRTNETNYVNFRPGSGCSSSVGMVGGMQSIILASSCSTGSTIHEIGHALGLWHEQSRADRDNYIIINTDNISQGRKHNFQTYIERGKDGFDHLEFDFGSIMLYSSFAFSANGLPTITKLDGSTYNVQRTALSDNDKACANQMYPSLYIIQDKYLSSVDYNSGAYKTLGGAAWQGTEAMTASGDMLYAVQDGYLWEINPFDGSYTALGGQEWANTDAMTYLNGSLYIVQGKYLYKVNKNTGAYKALGGPDWLGTEGITSVNNRLYIVQDGYLWRVNPSNGSFTALGEKVWASTDAMTSLDGSLYIVQDKYLHKVDKNTGAYVVLNKPANWSNTLAMTSVNGYLYIIQDKYLYQVDKNTGAFTALNKPANWTGSDAMTSF